MKLMRIALLKDPERLSRMSQSALKVAQPDAADALADLVEKTAALAPHGDPG